MAFDFPTAPATGTLYQPPGGPTYRYTGSVWNVVIPPFQGAVSSDTAPGTPVPGQLWWESDTGQLFVWFNDGNTSQWVQVSGSSIPDAPADGEKYVRVNGVWQKQDGVVKISEGVTASALSQFIIPLPTSGYRTFELYGNDIVVNATCSIHGNFSWDNGVTYPVAVNQYYFTWLTQTTAAPAAAGQAGTTSAFFIAGSAGVASIRSAFKAWFPCVVAGDYPTFYSEHWSYNSTAYMISRNAHQSALVAGPPTHMRIAVSAGLMAAGARWQLNGVR